MTAGTSSEENEKASRTSAGATAPTWEPVFTGWRKTVNVLGIVAWAFAFLFFWSWWLHPQHVHTAFRYAVVTGIMLWVTLIPLYFIAIFASARTLRSEPDWITGARIAIVVTKTPSEPFSLVKKTLEGALAQSGCKHDTWLADEEPNLETLSWCKKNGVQVSTRQGVAEYHRPDWPRRKRCKEGNLAYFYDHFGYERYDFVTQFDADHVPTPDYLRCALAPFADPTVGYVSAPSICDSNAEQSWSARGRLYVEASMHGALQAGYNNHWAPLCIGSHYTVRTAALRAVGGLGPELAEDHSTTLILNAGGWTGVHAVDAIAHGRGPETFSDLATQEFQWARSLVTILLKYAPTYLSKLPPRLRFQFIFSELWYPMFSSIMALMFMIPIIALATGSHFVNVTYIDYVVHILPLSLTMLFLAYWWRSTGMFRPTTAPILSWEGISFIFLRWPWSLLGCLAALKDRITGTRIDFRITPKGMSRSRPISFRVLAPYLVLALVPAAFALGITEAGTAAGFYIFNLIAAITNGLCIVLILCRHARENRQPIFSVTRSNSVIAFFLVLLVGLTGAAVHENGAKALAAMNVGITTVTLTEISFSPSGAGRESVVTIRFQPKWHRFLAAGNL